MSQPWSPNETRDLVKAQVEGALKDRYPSRAVGGNRSLAAAYTKLSRLQDAGVPGYER